LLARLKRELAKQKKKLEEDRAKAKAALDAKEAEAKTRQAAADAKTAKYQGLMDKFSNPDTTFEDACWGELVSVAQTVTGAGAVYLGLLEEDGLQGEAPGPCIAYTSASAGSEWMVDTVLPDQTGVTWGALKQPVEEEDCFLFGLFFWATANVQIMHAKSVIQVHIIGRPWISHGRKVGKCAVWGSDELDSIGRDINSSSIEVFVSRKARLRGVAVGSDNHVLKTLCQYRASGHEKDSRDKNGMNLHGG